MHYTSYGLSISSTIALPELQTLDRKPEQADVEIRIGQVGEGGLDNGKQLGPFLWASPDALSLEVPNVARFLVREGREIVVEPVPGIDEDSVRVFLLGSAFGALLFQRGLLVLHGNAVRVGDQCLVCVGPSGAGKSTLAAGFMQRGHEILADDVVPVDAECRAVPGFPRLKLWRDAVDRLDIDAGPLKRIRPETEKFNYPLVRQFAEKPLPVRWVYILGTHQRSDTVFETIHGMQRFQPLHNNTYRVRFLQGMALKGEHLQLCGRLAGRIRLTQVTRPQKGFELESLMDRILADIADNP